MSIYRKNKNSMKQADKEARTAKEESTYYDKGQYALLFQIEESKDDETLLQTGKVWCDCCYTWIEQVEKKDNYLCCSACGNGVVLLT